MRTAPRIEAAKYVSPDTTPEGFAVHRSPLTAPLFLVVSGVSGAAGLLFSDRFAPLYIRLLASLTHTRVAVLGEARSMAIRVLVLTLLGAIALFSAGGWRQRLRLLGFFWLGYAVAAGGVDLLLARFATAGAPRPFSFGGDFLSGLTGVVLIVVAILRMYRLPSDVRVEQQERRPSRFGVRVAVGVVIGALSSVALTELMSRLSGSFPRVPILRPFTGTVTLFILACTTWLFVIDMRERGARLVSLPLSMAMSPLSMAIVMPAHNEAHVIAESIRHLDLAAANYHPWHCRLYVVENGSWDDTTAVSQRALDSCGALKGVVVSAPVTGKAAALNVGVRMCREEIVVRVDADTLLPPLTLVRIAQRFSDPSVGGVGGLPLPKDRHGLLARIRAVEVYLSAFRRSAQNAIDSVMVLAGMVAAYRREVLIRLGGFAEGLNGEDADMTVRVGRLGYRIVYDAGIRVYTEVPDSLFGMREQRMRWARGGFTVVSRNRSAMRRLQGVRGVWFLPWAILSLPRRSLLLPFLLSVALFLVVRPAQLTLRDGAALGGIALGLPIILISLILAANRQFSLIPMALIYILWRLFLAYVGLEALLTIPLMTGAERRKARESEGGQIARASESRPDRVMIDFPSAAAISKELGIHVSGSRDLSSSTGSGVHWAGGRTSRWEFWRHQVQRDGDKPYIPDFDGAAARREQPCES